MITPLRILAEKAIKIKEDIEEKIGKQHGIYTLRVPILMYHHIGYPEKEDNKKLFVDPLLFKKEMEYLERNKYTTITLDDLTFALKQKKMLSKKSIILTFDDGYLDFYTNAFPILRKYRFKSTVFVTTSFVGQKWNLSSSLLIQLQNSSLIIFGSHTVTHPNLTKITERELLYEIRESKNSLEKKLGIKINSFAYPFGTYNRNIIYEVIKAGYSNAVVTEYGSLHEPDKIYALKRIRISNKISQPDFERRIANSQTS